MHALVSTLVLALAPPHIAEVVVYPDRAQVTRVQSIACGAQAQAVQFEGITPAADPATFRARSSLGTVEGLRSESRTRADAFAPQVAALDEKIRALAQERAALADQLGQAQTQGRIAGSYADVAARAVAREMADGAPNAKAWGSAFDQSVASREGASADEVAVRAKLRTLDRKLGDARDERARLGNAAARSDYFAEVLVACPSGQAGKNTDVELSYLVGGASWDPAYEARADEAGGAVELSTYATVHQSTGEAWSHARVILSTAVPRQDATPPDPQPLRLYAQERQPERKVIVRREERVEHAEASTPAAGPSGEGLRAAAQGLSVQLAVPGESDVPGDGSPARLFVQRTKMAARFSVRTIPKLMPYAFRTAELTNSAPFPLLAGPLDAYRQAGLASRYPLDRVAEGARFHLTFGLDESVRVRRDVVEEVQRDKSLLSTTRRFHYRYRFDVANWGARAIDLELTDPLPVSELDDVKVAIDPPTTPGYTLRAEDGQVVWRVPLKPGEQKRVEHSFHVDVPSSYDAGSM